MGSKKFDLSKVELIKIGKYLLRGMLYALVTGLIVVVSHLNIPGVYAFLIPTVTVLLTNASLTLRKWMTDTTLPLPTPDVEKIPE